MYQPRCVYLTCKSMQVWGEDFESDPEYQAGMIDFWCTVTFKDVGPDGAPVNLPACSIGERTCFRASAEILPPSAGPQ